MYPAYVLLFYFIIHLQIEERLPSYMDAYDIVLLDDQTMNAANAIVSLIQ